MILKNGFDSEEYDFIEIVFETVVLASSMKDDFSALLKTFQENEIPEYEEMIQTGKSKLLEKVEKQMEMKELDYIFNADFRFDRMFGNTVMLTFSGDGVRKR